jgi:hypothetical protein
MTPTPRTQTTLTHPVKCPFDNDVSTHKSTVCQGSESKGMGQAVCLVCIIEAYCQGIYCKSSPKSVQHRLTVSSVSSHILLLEIESFSWSRLLLLFALELHFHS